MSINGMNGTSAPSSAGNNGSSGGNGSVRNPVNGLHGSLEAGSTATEKPKVVKLTRREAEVLTKVIEGKKSKDVAEELYVSKRTVDFHLANIYGKLAVKNRVQALREATRRGLLTYNPDDTEDDEAEELE